eukprot:NODE_4129_length_360_cov_280.456592_g3545_i0.p2 GENE.NODE_4129_length_360_cov_280.456592_g3545_i0~~NODE_4129_length_360_cov_280.456592_g3545_i0.p2  ORF type:complete len:105 (-),score=22.82 NODE_4129_length_360_cov_280.456592_g3545_i0:45-335(-)
MGAAALTKAPPPVMCNALKVETPMLLSATGAAVTFLNWAKRPFAALGVNATVIFKISQVSSVVHGQLKFKVFGTNMVSFTIPLANNSADVVLIEKA